MSELVIRVNTEHKLNQPEPCSFPLFTNHPDHSKVKHVAFLITYLFVSQLPSSLKSGTSLAIGLWITVDHLLFSVTFLLVAVDKGMRYRGNRY